ncbi:hypothetical protein [Pinibacter soli]|uniref:Glycine zipper family protein n=1 Tax=Pinibacter soli TaxID=3044211 RepID=A0ABT6RDI9_9BACT|nr:hypothetical protein [Pinibacter soli]MDI3320634.1 hypothetical protein [Pinibacter soli]
MKLLALLVSITLCYSICAQKPLFIRVYNFEGEKVDKGFILAITDTLVIIAGDKGNDTIRVKDIGAIRTKHSAAHNLGIGAGIGTVGFVTYGIASADPDEFLGYTAAEGALMGLIVGVPVGGALGALTLPFKDSKHFIIYGDAERWKAFNKMVVNENFTNSEK